MVVVDHIYWIRALCFILCSTASLNKLTNNVVQYLVCSSGVGSICSRDPV